MQSSLRPRESCTLTADRSAYLLTCSPFTSESRTTAHGCGLQQNRLQDRCSPGSRTASALGLYRVPRVRASAPGEDAAMETIYRLSGTTEVAFESEPCAECC